MSGAPSLSIVIPTFNRLGRLTRVLDALERQSVPPERFEVVVADDGSTDGTGEALSSARRPFTLRTTRQENSGPARARNAGVAMATGDLVLFIDDDVEPLPDLVREHLDSHAAHPRSVIIGPLLSLPHYAQPWVAWEQVKLEAQYAAMTRGDWAPSFRQFWTGNASVSRREILDAGGFNPEFLRGEDVELGYRLAERGLGFHFNARAGGIHHAERSLASWENAHRSYGRLEVEIFGRAGEADMLDSLARNWNRLHRVTRWTIGRCLGHPARAERLSEVLRKSLTFGAVAPNFKGVQGACSVFANLLYWTACVAALGPDRTSRMFALAETLR